MRRSATVAASILVAAVPALLPFPEAAAGQSVLERPPNLHGTWVGSPGRLHFNFRHLFELGPAPERKVGNAPTFLLAAPLPGSTLAGVRYGSSSGLVGRVPNEWELFGRYAPLARRDGSAVDLTVTVAYNEASESVDGEVMVARELGPLRLMAGARAFSAFARADGRAAMAGGAVLRLGERVALAGDVASLLDPEDGEDPAWSAGLQLAIPYTPHTLSLQATNANTATLEGASIGTGETRWGFEFTVPITLDRYFGDGEEATGSGDAGGEIAAEVTMTNRLAFAPDTLRIRAGEAVRWRNTSDLLHTVTADPDRARRPGSVRLPDGAEAFDSGNMEPGESYVRTFTVPGEYRYFCVPHELAGMVGTIVVER